MKNIGSHSERLTAKYPMLQYFTDRPFGVELEFYGLEYLMTPLDKVIKPYNIRSKGKDGGTWENLCSAHCLEIDGKENCWHLEEDSSIRHRGGVELISPILKGIDGLRQVYRAMQLIQNIKGCEIDESCGFHVHHGVDPEVFNCNNLRELLRIVYPMEDYFYFLIPGDRQRRETCRPVEIDVSEFLKECSKDCHLHGCRVRRVWYSAENRHESEGGLAARYNKTRYHGLNLHSYWYRSTIEFRYHSAVLYDIDEAMQWIIFTQFLVEMSQGGVRLIRYYPKTNKWLKAIYKVYLAHGYMNRISWDVDESRRQFDV